MSDGSGIEKIDLDKVDWRGSREFFESLGEALDKLDDKDESYDFTWVGKRKSIIEAGAPINKTFRPDVENSKNWDTTENLFIEGDNLDTLKLLQESYLGKVKMIYIDPPYNTGKDFVYHDNFKASTEQYDEDTEYRDDEGNIQFKKNEKSNGRYHSDWLSMMYPRLKLARNLMADDGLIFISIGDDEQANLKKICDEIFGEDNFINKIVWKKNSSGKTVSETYPVNIDYLYIYSRSSSYTLKDIFKPLSASTIKMYSKDDNDGRGKYRLYPLQKTGSPGPETTYDYIDNSGKVWKCPAKGWRINKNKLKALENDGRLALDGNTLNEKAYWNERTNDGQIADTLWDDIAENSVGTAEVDRLIGKGIFTNPKPTELIMRCVRTVCEQDSIVLDFFCGSGTTAHTVMQLNAEDGGNRKWIMVQLPEEADENSEAFKAGYKTIPDIARERIRRAGDKIAAEHPEAKVDYGFRALTIADTNYKDVFKPAGQLQQADLLSAVDNVKEDRTDLDLLYGVLTQSALELNRPITTIEIAGATVYQYDYFGEVSGLIACFASDVPEETIKAIAKLKPLTAVFRDSSFADSQAKVNLAEHFRILSPDTKVKVV